MDFLLFYPSFGVRNSTWTCNVSCSLLGDRAYILCTYLTSRLCAEFSRYTYGSPGWPRWIIYNVPYTPSSRHELYNTHLTARHTRVRSPCAPRLLDRKKAHPPPTIHPQSAWLHSNNHYSFHIVRRALSVWTLSGLWLRVRISLNRANFSSACTSHIRVLCRMSLLTEKIKLACFLIF